MADTNENARLRAHIEQLAAENTSLSEGSFRGSKAEALMAFEYDRIPNVMKTTKAITLQRRIATVVMILVPLLVLAIGAIGGFQAYRDWQASAENQRAVAESGRQLRKGVEDALRR